MYRSLSLSLSLPLYSPKQKVFEKEVAHARASQIIEKKLEKVKLEDGTWMAVKALLLIWNWFSLPFSLRFQQPPPPPGAVPPL